MPPEDNCVQFLAIHYFARARALLNRIVCVNFCSPSKHSYILLTLPRTNHGRLVKPEHDQTSSCQFPEFSNTLARAPTRLLSIRGSRPLAENRFSRSLCIWWRTLFLQPKRFKTNLKTLATSIFLFSRNRNLLRRTL